VERKGGRKQNLKNEIGAEKRARRKGEYLCFGRTPLRSCKTGRQRGFRAWGKADSLSTRDPQTRSKEKVAFYKNDGREGEEENVIKESCAFEKAEVWCIREGLSAREARGGKGRQQGAHSETPFRLRYHRGELVNQRKEPGRHPANLRKRKKPATILWDLKRKG